MRSVEELKDRAMQAGWHGLWVVQHCVPAVVEWLLPLGLLDPFPDQRGRAVRLAAALPTHGHGLRVPGATAVIG